MPVFTDPTLVRDVVLVLHSAVVLYSILFSATFISQWYRGALRKMNDVRLAWSVFMAGMACNSFSFIMSDFYFTMDPGSLLWIKTGYLMMMVSLIGFFFALEKILPYKTRHGFTIAGAIVAAITVLAPREYLTALALSASLVVFGILVLFFTFFVRNTSGIVKQSMRMIVVGFIIGFVGYLLRSDFIYYGLGEPAYLFGAFCLVAGLLIMGVAVLGSPALDELDWKEQMLELYVIHSSGILMYHEKFIPTVDLDENLTAAGLAGAQELFKEITQSKAGLNTLSIGEFDILFAQRNDFTTVLVASSPYRVLLDKVRDFSDQFELLFGVEAKTFSGEVTQFNQASRIAQKLFSTTTAT
ncbi:MAG: hypothetical protein E4H14_15825 [Candidatus Thorarchaeota archaeon]|nr:MAG: hypothetical protein E4H14_15825 [Candidatus Thorarchaeota archaeon]